MRRFINKCSMFIAAVVMSLSFSSCDGEITEEQLILWLCGEWEYVNDYDYCSAYNVMEDGTIELSFYDAGEADSPEEILRGRFTLSGCVLTYIMTEEYEDGVWTTYDESSLEYEYYSVELTTSGDKFGLRWIGNADDEMDIASDTTVYDTCTELEAAGYLLADVEYYTRLSSDSE